MRAAALAVCLVIVGCNHYDGYQCTDSKQCVLDGVDGVCEETGFCSFPDPSCESGRKYEPHTGNGLADTCVVGCGHQGEACCAAEVSCTGNAFCQSEMCATCVVDVALGRRFICAAKYDGTVWCSGANDQGQLGNGAVSATPRAIPAQVRDGNGQPLTDVVDVGAGYDFACAVKNDGSVWCWGANSRGQLGDGVNVPIPPPPPMPPPPPPPPVPWAVQVIMTNDQKLTGAAEVAGGDDWACARMHSGAVNCWGFNASGRLGDGTTDYARSKAAPVKNLAGVAEIGLGGDHSCARTTANNILCWGNGAGGRLFDNGTMARTTPVMVANAQSFATGKFLTCIVGPDTTISCAGWNGHGRFGIGTGESYEDGDHVSPLQTLTELGGPPFTGVAEVASGGVTCARMIDKSVYCWGDGTYGGTGTGVGSTVPLPVVFADGKPLTGVKDIFVHYQHACAITETGDLLCWGRNLQGELANGSFLNQGHPAPYTIGCR